MPKQPSKLVVSKEPGQYSLDLPNYLVRIIPQWGQPSWWEASFWRNFVKQQPVATAAKEYILSSIVSLDWMIVTREDNMRDELKLEIDYYTNLFENLGGMDYAGYIEWIGGDMLDLPFGGAAEVGRQGDRENGKVLWTIPIDAATLFPTLDTRFPVGQTLQDSPFQTVYFPPYAINRVYYSPRSDIRREGYGMAPPEKIFLAMAALGRGDSYYANLLLDTPEAGILDLGDMAKDSALEWVNSFRTLLNGIDPFKIPVLYEHENPVNYIPFGRPPTELMFDAVTAKYAALTCAGYGIGLASIGLKGGGESGGDTLAGAIREERKDRHTGVGRAKKKLKNHFDRLLPPTLEFKFIDYDDERSLTLGRARMASATAFGQMIANAYISPQEARLQMIADGLITIAVPENIPPDAKPQVTQNPTRDRQIGFNQSPSLGGHGDITAQRAQYLPEMKGRSELENLMKQSFAKMVSKATDDRLERLIRRAIKVIYPQISTVNQSLTGEELEIWRDWYAYAVYDMIDNDVPMVKEALEGYDAEIEKELSQEDQWWKVDMSPEALVAIFMSAYQLTIQQAAQEMAHQLYVEGLIDSPTVLQPFRLQNEQIKSLINRLAQELNDNLTSGGRYFIRRAVISVLKDELTRPEVAGVDIDTLLSNNVFIAHLVDQVRIELSSRLQDRAEIDAEYEIGNIENLALTDEYHRAGLTRKHWVCYGPNPCELCIENQSRGYVPMNYVFKAVHGDVHGPKAHERCHCGLEYDAEDLRQAFESGDFNLWYGD